MKYMSLKNMTDEEKKERKRKQKNEAQKRYYRKNKEYYKNYNKEHNFYKDKCVILQSKIDKVNRILNANTHVENIYHALCNLFDEEYQYEIDNEELNKILKVDK